MKITLLLLLLTVPLRATEIGRAGAHVFHSSFWLNLHERLRHEAVQKTPAEHAFTGAELSAWRQALEIYRADVGTKSPVFDRPLALVWHTLSETPDGATPKGIPPRIAEALRIAAPAYRAKLWKQDDAANRFWTSVAVTLLREAGPEVAAGIARVYGVTWMKRIDVEVAPYCDEHGAATPEVHKGKYLTVVSSRDPGYQEFHALEMMFHEPMHHFDFYQEIEMAAGGPGAKTPRNLSHALLFYTAGEITRRALSNRGVVYEPNSDEVLGRAWPHFIEPIDQHWKPVIDGRSTRAEALKAILAAHRPRTN
ncbi:MAG TPA: hypothetical protein VNI54_17210 [Thermoanaerobaculia bacterium]|nr:hypothetical protein [Thermoanaerobaculia bacterium]